ncbi:hypothetical protein BGX26_000807 [Mortierella sp. AD094]|nr:hypothetical protein BGX26_000807 [Mortierella sp. AD094]
MTRSGSLVAGAPRPSSAAGMRFSIQVHNDTFININGKPIPVVYGTLECPALISATVTLETDKECTGDELEVVYRAMASYKTPNLTINSVHTEIEQSFQKKRWIVDLNRPKQGKVAAGRYVKQVSAVVDPLWPSSARTVEHFLGDGCMKYDFMVRFSKIDIAKTTILFESQEVWVLNSVLPLKGYPSILEAPSSQPITVQEIWKKSSLPVSLSLLSDTLSMAQVVPVTLKMDPFSEGSKYFGKKIVVLGAYFAVREKAVCEDYGLPDAYGNTRNVITVPVRHEWPQTAGPWERTVNLVMPMSPGISTSMTLKCMNISHSVALVMKIKAEGERDYKSKEFEIQIPVYIVAPRVTETNGNFLPAYSLTGTD